MTNAPRTSIKSYQYRVAGLHDAANSIMLTSNQRVFSMQRRRAKAIAITQQQVFQTKLLIAAGMLLLPALLLLLISP
ncbi:hypothetical protein [Devosia riboflavina]